jgi:hypothetical protein
MIRFFKKHLSIIFILATFMGVFHQHNDLKPHNDCQICTIQSNIANADTPVDVVYLHQIDTYSEATTAGLSKLYSSKIYLSRKARAPPQIS